MTIAAPFWIFPLLPIVLMLLCAGVVYWALSQMAPLGSAPRVAAPAPRPAAVTTGTSDRATLASMLAAPTPVADDLTVVEGIGPRIAEVLRAAGITSLSALAAATPQQLEQILRAAGLTLASPESWPEQARLAAAGKTAELTELQHRLRAGRVA